MHPFSTPWGVEWVKWYRRLEFCCKGCNEKCKCINDLMLVLCLQSSTLLKTRLSQRHLLVNFNQAVKRRRNNSDKENFQPATLLRMRPWHKCFLVKFVNCLRTSILLDLFIVFIVYWGAPSLLRLSHLPVIFSFSYATGLLFLLFTSLSFCHGEPIRRRQIGDNFCRPISAKRGNLSKVGKNYPPPP